MPDGLALTPLAGVILIVVMLVAGRQFRTEWKRQAPGWRRRAWLWAVPVLISFALLAFLPLRA